jgi:septin family protein
MKLEPANPKDLVSAIVEFTKKLAVKTDIIENKVVAHAEGMTPSEQVHFYERISQMADRKNVSILNTISELTGIGNGRSEENPKTGRNSRCRKKTRRY